MRLARLRRLKPLPPGFYLGLNLGMFITSVFYLVTESNLEAAMMSFVLWVGLVVRMPT